MKRIGIIYKATNKINSKVYIGQTIKSLDKRKSQHSHMSSCASGKRKQHKGFRCEISTEAID